MDDLTPRDFSLMGMGEKITPIDQEKVSSGIQSQNVGESSPDEVSQEIQDIDQYVTFTFYADTFVGLPNQGIPATIIIDRTCTIEEVYIHVETAPGLTKTLTIDVHKNGTTIFTTQANRPSITGTDTTATGVPDVTSLVENNAITMDVDVHTGVAAKLTVYVRCKI